MTPTAPLVCTTGSLVATRDLRDISAIFRLAPKSYRAESQGKRWDLIEGLQEYAWTAAADFQIMRVSRRWSADEFADRLLENQPPRTRNDLWAGHVKTQHDALSQLSPWTPAVFLSVRLADPAADMYQGVSRILESSVPEAKEAARTWWSKTRERARNMRGQIDMDVYAPRLETAEDRVTACFPDARRATEDELQWLIKRGFHRGFGEPSIVPSGVFDSEMEDRIRSMEWWLDRVPVRRFNGYLEFEPEPGTTIYQGGLCLCELKDAKRFTRESELMFTPLEDFAWPIDASMNFRWIRPTEAQKKAERQSGRKQSEFEDADETVIGANLRDRRKAEYAKELHDGLIEAGDEPLLWGTISLMTYGSTLAELNERLRAMEERLPHEWQRPTADQVPLFIQTSFPGQRALTVGYERPYTCESVAAMVPQASHEAGSSTPRAYYIGKTLGRRPQPILFDLGEASATNKPPTIGLSSTLGGGKTFLLQLLNWHAFIRGDLVCDLDPKGDHRWHRMPEVAPHCQEIVLGPDRAHRGKLDPLRTAHHSQRHDAATTFLIDILPQKIDAEVEAAISGAVSRTITAHRERACCMEVVRELEDGEKDSQRRAGALLREYCDGDAGIAQLGFAALDDPLPSESRYQVTYVNCRALQRANLTTVRSEMTQGQRHGKAVLQLLSLFGMNILGTDRNIGKQFCFDEMSFITADAGGAQWFDQLGRWGRSENGRAIAAYQLLDDMAGLENLIGPLFIFAMRHPPEAQRALDQIGLDPEGPLVDEILRWGHRDGLEGSCLFRDLQGRCETMRVDAGSTRLRDAWKTTPEESKPDELKVA